MWLKLLLAIFFVVSLLGAFVVSPVRERERARESNSGNRAESDHVFRLLTWNVGNGDLESETRAHKEDLPAVARVILDNDADAVALQELTGKDQLRLLLQHLENHYSGYVCNSAGGDRVEAVLIKTSERGDSGAASPIFSDVPAGNRFAAAAAFHVRKDLPEVVLVSAHADAFSASRRRTFAAGVTDWSRSHSKSELTFIAGDFNFEVSTRNKNNLFTDDAKHDSESYAYLLKYFRDLGLDAGETSINDRRIDYIFGPVANVTLRRAEVLRSAAVGRMDHWPLLIEVSF
ncbi:MAG TPA: endonuclease/exonuclease/phosphatase family protein [Pyrinomonadaceae bacterium]|nr:endonuclease/exonuclease/phosphatase family protein [Pyrinomonadaceae bacterium]